MLNSVRKIKKRKCSRVFLNMGEMQLPCLFRIFFSFLGQALGQGSQLASN